MKNLLFFLSFLFSPLFLVAEGPTVVITKKGVEIQHLKDRVRFIKTEIVDSTMCHPPDPECNYLNRYERLRYDEFVVKNKSGIFVSDSVLLSAYVKRNTEEIFRFDEKLQNLKFFGLFKKSKEFKTKDILFLEKEIIIQESSRMEVSSSLFYLLYVLFLFSLSILVFNVDGEDYEFFCPVGAAISLISFILFFIWLILVEPPFGSLSIVLFLLQFIVVFASFIAMNNRKEKYPKWEYAIALIIILLNSYFLNFYIILFIILLPIFLFLYQKYDQTQKHQIDFDV